MMKFSLALVACLFAFGVSAQSDQERPRKSPEEHFAKIDKDGDGFINMEEAENGKKGNLAEKFKKVDKDRDGLISLVEFKEHGEARRARRENKGQESRPE